MPSAMWFSLSVMTDQEMSRFLITGLNCNFVIEWHDMFLAIVKLIWSIYNHGQQKIKILAN